MFTAYMADTRDLADEARSLLTDDYDGLRPYHDLAEQLCGSVPFTQDDVVSALDGCDEPTLIPEHEFTDYARDLAEDCGLLTDDRQWPLTCIDWEQAARELRTDYTSVTFDSASFLVRKRAEVQEGADGDPESHGCTPEDCATTPSRHCCIQDDAR